MTRKEARRASEDERIDAERRRGRGAVSNATGRFEPERRERFDDGWESLQDLEPFKTEVREEAVKTIIATNASPDVGFDRSINPYRGCEHGCIYCYARPSHAYWGHSAGLDFETKLTAKVNAAQALEKELSKPGYRPATIMLGANTDAYQPIERERKITRAILEVLDRFRHPTTIVTKSALVLRDLDILSRLASRGLVKVSVSVTTLDRTLARKMEPRASTPGKRIEAIRQLSAAGVPVAVLAAPLIPALNDHEIEAILQASAAAGASEAGYVLLRLPLEISPLFQEWLETAFPERAARVMSLVRSTRGGKDYAARFGERQTGTGPYAAQIAARFQLALKRNGLDKRHLTLRNDLFQAPGPTQLSLF
ncbi:MAG: PA0069 family radical SAM protein [Rhodomicrobium sp.]